MLKKILTYFEMLIVPHALHCVDSCIFVFTSFDTVWHTVLVSVPGLPACGALVIVFCLFFFIIIICISHCLIIFVCFCRTNADGRGKGSKGVQLSP